MTPRQIQNRLYTDLGKTSAIIVPNFTPRAWYESDVFRVTLAGVPEEFEIKMSMADFRIDSRKGPTELQKSRHENTPERWQHFPSYRDFDPRTKHERLMAGDVRGPARFSFVVPESISHAVVKELPPWAGLFEAVSHGGSCYIRKIITAKKLHRSKVDAEVLDTARRVFFHRYWNLRMGVAEDAGLEPVEEEAES